MAWAVCALRIRSKFKRGHRRVGWPSRNVAIRLPSPLHHRERSSNTDRFRHASSFDASDASSAPENPVALLTSDLPQNPRRRRCSGDPDAAKPYRCRRAAHRPVRSESGRDDHSARLGTCFGREVMADPLRFTVNRCRGTGASSTRAADARRRVSAARDRTRVAHPFDDGRVRKNRQRVGRARCARRVEFADDLTDRHSSQRRSSRFREFVEQLRDRAALAVIGTDVGQRAATGPY